MPQEDRKQNWFAKHKVLTGIIVIFIIIMIGGQGNSKSSSTSGQSNKVENADDSKTGKPTEEATKPIGKVEVRSHSQKQRSTGGVKIVGEVVNNTENPATYINVTATFYDKANEVLGSSFTYAGDASTPLAKGETAPFEVNNYPDKYIPDHYKLNVTWN